MADKAPDIRIHVKTTYLKSQSEPDEDRYAFAYTITITNHGDQGAQLISRHWRITDANHKAKEVYGEGVVGEQPHIAPGDSHTYTSGAVLETEMGTMEGEYQMMADDGQAFEAPIPRFTLSVPRVLH